MSTKQMRDIAQVAGICDNAIKKCLSCAGVKSVIQVLAFSQIKHAAKILRMRLRDYNDTPILYAEQWFTDSLEFNLGNDTLIIIRVRQ